jgi:gluconokinase
MSMAESPHLFEPGPVVIMGVSGSGKSLIGKGVAAALGVPFIEGDDLHPQANVDKMHNGTPLTDDDRWPWLDRVAQALKAASDGDGGAVAACSALKRSYRDRLRRELGGDLKFVFLEGSRALLAGRMGRRERHFMPISLLESQFATLEDPSGEAGVVTVGVGAVREEIIAGVLRGLMHRV